MSRSGSRKVYSYSDEFKLTAVQVSHQSGMRVRTVPADLEIVGRWTRSRFASGLRLNCRLYEVECSPKPRMEDKPLLKVHC